MDQHWQMSFNLCWLFQMRPAFSWLLLQPPAELACMQSHAAQSWSDSHYKRIQKDQDYAEQRTELIICDFAGFRQFYSSSLENCILQKAKWLNHLFQSLDIVAQVVTIHLRPIQSRARDISVKGAICHFGSGMWPFGEMLRIVSKIA